MSKIKKCHKPTIEELSDNLKRALVKYNSGIDLTPQETALVMNESPRTVYRKMKEGTYYARANKVGSKGVRILNESIREHREKTKATVDDWAEGLRTTIVR